MIEIRFGARRWTMTDGTALTFGRGANCAIRLGHDPEDFGVSRNAGTLLAVAGELLVRNESESRQHQLVPIPGRPRKIAPRETVGTGDPLSYLRVFGGGGAVYELVLDRRRRVTEGAPATVEHAPGRSTEGAPSVTPGEHRMLVELCRPLLLYAGEAAVPASHKEIAERLRVREDHVRRTLAALRARLAGAGVPDMTVEDGADVRTFSDALADWAIRSGLVGPESLGEPGGS